MNLGCALRYLYPLPPTNHAAHPRQIATTAANIAGPVAKYFQLSTIEITCTSVNAQPSQPIAWGLLPASVPKYQARNAENSNVTVMLSPNPR